MRPSTFWITTFVIVAGFGMATDNRWPLAVWCVCGAVVLLARGALAWKARRDEALARREVARLDAALDLLDGDAATLIADALRDATAACAHVEAALASRLAPTAALAAAELRTRLDRYRRGDDPADDLRRARAIRADALVLARQVASSPGVGRGTARTLGAVLGVWRGIDL